ncbi:MAG TPA: hypothetical protein VFG32_06530, partial [Bacteroidota bacterium]|nr:hypothetical protein [Bacteroidota bacterium]
HAELDNPTMQIYLAAESLWAVSMWTPVANQCLQPRYALEGCFLLMGYADTLVKIRRPDSVNVYPTYPNKNDSLAKKNYMDLELSVEFANTAIPNYWVKVDKPVLADSGGHSHDGNRPMGRYRLPKLVGQGFDTLASFTRRTDANGKLSFRYLASQFGGVERITAKLLSDTTSSDTLSLITRVPELHLLPDGSHYVKIGGTCLHHGPRDDTNYPNCRTPDTDHWGTNALIQAIQAVADAYDSLHAAIRLRINDMSLPYGGGFDLGGNWDDDIYDEYPTIDSLCNDVGHCTHRQGITVDVSHQGLNQSGNYVTIKLIDLRKIAQHKTGHKAHKEGDHDHIRVNE